MEKLHSLLDECETLTKVGFNCLDHCIHCYVHIINICSSHIVASVTSTSKSYLADLKVPVGSSHVIFSDSDDGLDDGASNKGLLDDDTNLQFNELQLAESFNALGDTTLELERWFSGIRHDPLRRARQ